MPMESRRSRPSRALVAAAALAVAAVLWIMPSCPPADEGGTGTQIESSRSYQGHATDADINNFVRTYPHAVGTRLDDCQTCHSAGTVLDHRAARVRANPCDFCHFVIHEPEGWTQLPESFTETLNPYGTTYQEAGRDADAIRDIAQLDSDGDGHANAAEIQDLRYPGDPGSYPGLARCPVLTVSLAEIRALPPHKQFTLANANKQQFDVYATYTGVKISDLLAAKGVDLSGATSVDLLAPDGYTRTFTVEQITRQYPPHRFFAGFGVEDLGEDCAFVAYPSETYGYAHGDTIVGEQWHLLAYQRDGLALNPSHPDPASGQIVGEGPLRNVVPPAFADEQRNRPDRGIHWETSSCTLPEWNYDEAKDHNAGSMVKGVVIIRVNPMPEGCEEFDIVNGGWSMVDAEQLLIYGHGVGSDQGIAPQEGPPRRAQ